MHTPGPWTLNDEGNSIVVSGGPNNDDIADFSYSEEHTVSITRDEALANARLFVAAPEMADALNVASVALRDSLAITKATGFTVAATSAVAALALIRAALAKAGNP